MIKTALQVAFITGRSQPNNWQLTPIQEAFIDKLGIEAEQKVKLNFPYGSQAVQDPSSSNLLQASYYNCREYLSSRRNQFIECYQQNVIQLLNQATQTLFIAGSCGLELFNNLHLPIQFQQNIHIFAYGPVARMRPTCRHILVQGQQDMISRLWFRQADIRIQAGHMSYLTHPKLAELCKQFMQECNKENRCSAY